LLNLNKIHEETCISTGPYVIIAFVSNSTNMRLKGVYLMLKNLFLPIKWMLLFYCVIFTIATLANSVGTLWLGQETNPDVHGHIILRAGICLGIAIIATIIKFLFLKGNIKT
jgi:hypothetical protein